MHLTKEKKNDYLLYFLAFIIPTLIFFIYFVCRKMNILTVDLGQQYVDFLSFFKNNLFKNPLSLIYNFNQGLGGSFIATSAYYLTSPLNLLLFLIPNNLLPQGILIIISLKLGLIGLTSYYLWQKSFINESKIYALAASLAFALSGYTICYNLNLMWLDSLILLPLLIDAINRIFGDQNNFKYLCLITFLLWFTNFYTGYMALLFGFLYFLGQVFINHFKATYLKTYFGASILATALDAFLLLSTFIELLAGKTHSNTQWNLNWQLMPWNVFNKFVTGSFSFHEMSDGWPNVYFAISFLFLTFLYFMSNKFTPRARIANGLLLIFLFISLSFNPLVLIWHMGQFPVWYPARASFAFIFLAINLAINLLSKQTSLTKLQLITCLILAIVLIAFWVLNLKHVAFLNSTKVMISAAFIICSLLLFIFINKKYACLFFYTLVGLEVSINLVLSLDSISYQKNSNYVNYTQRLTALTNKLHKDDPSFYRIEKNFNHTDNDPFSDNYYGISNFNSISNAKVINLVDNLGLKNNDNSYSYQYSDLLTDSLLGIKYFIVSNDNSNPQFNENYYRSDLSYDSITKNNAPFKILKNKYTFPIVMVSKKPSNIQLNSSALENQNKLFNSLTDNHTSLFQPVFWPVAKLKNVTQTGTTYHKIKDDREVKIIFDFTCETNNTYYLELSPDLTSSSASLYINNHLIDTSDLGTTSKLIPIASNDQHKLIKIIFDLYNKEINLGSCHLYQFNNQAYQKAAKHFDKLQPKIFQTSALSLNFNTKNSQKRYVHTTIPYSKNWLVLDNGRLIKTKSWLNTFISFKLTKGKHNIRLVYVPFELLIGLVITLISLIILIKIKKT